MTKKRMCQSTTTNIIRTAFLVIFSLVIGAPCYAQDAPNQTKLRIHVCVKKGKLVVDRAKTLDDANVFQPSEVFTAQLARGWSREKLLKLLCDDLDEAFGRMDKVFVYALQGDEQTRMPTDNLTKELGEFTDGTDCWKNFKEQFAAWVSDGQTRGIPRQELKEVFSRAGMFMASSFELPLKPTALILTFTGGPNPVSFEEGRLLFRVADPVKSISDVAIDFTGENDNNAAQINARRERIRRLLAALEGRLWRHKEIKPLIEDYYAERGLQAQVVISPANNPQRRIEITESPRIGRVLFPDDTPSATIDKLTYLLFPEREFRRFVAQHPRPLSEFSIKVKKEGSSEEVAQRFLVASYERLGRKPGTEPYLNQFQFQIQQLQLSELGYLAMQHPGAVAASTSGQLSYVDLFMVKTAESTREEDRKPDNTPPPPPPVPNQEGVLQAGIERPLRQTGFVAPVTAHQDTTTAGDTAADTAPPAGASAGEKTLEEWRPRERKNYLGFGVEYSPGQKVRAFGIYQRALPGQSNVSFKFGGQQGALGAVNYFADYVLFNVLKRKLAVQLTGSSDFVANRLFAGAPTDERRSGGLLRAELELFRDLGGALLRVYLEGRRDTVALTRADKPVGKQNLTTLDLGSLFLFERNEAYRPKRLRLEPRLRVGLGLAHNEPVFTVFSLAGNYHRQLPKLLELDLSNRVQVATRQTPLFELPSFGGEEMVRGFRRDDALGRRVWSWQSELWLPVPGVSRSAEGIGRFLRRQVRLAGFADVGGAYQTVDSRPGTRFGPGLGARIIFSPVVIKLDWAYGIGDAATGRGRGRFYFSVNTNLPL